MTAGHHLDGLAVVSLVVQLSNGDRLAECIDTVGDVAYWVLRPLCSRHEAEAVHGSADAAPHELLGSLSRDCLHRVAAVPLRCGRPRQDGRPCRSEVPRVGDVCRRHRPMTSQPCTGK